MMNKKEAWQLYVNPINYYNPLGKYAEANIYVENGELILAYRVMSLHPKAQEYHSSGTKIAIGSAIKIME